MTEKTEFIFVNCIKPLDVHENAKSFISDKLQICIPDLAKFIKEQKELGQHLSTIEVTEGEKKVTKEVMYIDIRKAKGNPDKHYSVLNTWKPDEKKAEKKSNTSDDDDLDFLS